MTMEKPINLNIKISKVLSVVSFNDSLKNMASQMICGLKKVSVV